MAAPEHLLSSLALALRQVLEALSVVTVAFGLLGILRIAGRRRTLEAMRLHLGRWLSMALEFQLAADIVATTVNPNGEQLIQLAVVAVIRTFLNVFLAREISQERSEADPVDRASPDTSFPLP
jgi:Predicted membrane protein